MQAVESLAKSERTKELFFQFEKVCFALMQTTYGDKVRIDFSITSPDAYYCGIIFKGYINGVSAKVLSGGRYDNLTGVFGVDGLSGVGISFGADRIYDVLNQLDLYPKTTVNQTQVIFLNFGEKEMEYCIPLLAKLRAAGIPTEIYPDAVKFKKQMQYANDRNIPFVAIVGETEMAENVVMLKDMTTGNQEKVLINDIVSKLAQ